MVLEETNLWVLKNFEKGIWKARFCTERLRNDDAFWRREIGSRTQNPNSRN